MTFHPRRWTGGLAALALFGSLAGATVADEQPNTAKIPSSEPVTADGITPVSLRLTQHKSEDPLIRQVQEAVDISTRRYLDADVHTPWQIVHGILAYRLEYQIKKDGKLINALEYISSGPTFEGIQWFEKTRYGGRGHTFIKPYAFEGHPNQFQAILTMSELPLTHTFKARDATVVPSDKAPVPQVADTTVTIADMIQSAKMEANTREEMTWTLWFLGFYLPPNEQWINKEGEPWSMERLVKMQVDASPYNAACGGTHQLFALARARNAYLQTGRPLQGVWLEADQKVKHFVEVARHYQTKDGSFSTDHFKGPKPETDFAKRLPSFGHTLEFLMVALPQNRLKEEWVQRAVYRLSRDIIDHRAQPAECGALYHSIDALVIYLQRVNPPPAKPLANDGADKQKPVEQTGGAEPMPTEPPQLLAPGEMD